MKLLISVFGRLLGYYVAYTFQIKFLCYRGHTLAQFNDCSYQQILFLKMFGKPYYWQHSFPKRSVNFLSKTI